MDKVEELMLMKDRGILKERVNLGMEEISMSISIHQYSKIYEICGLSFEVGGLSTSQRQDTADCVSWGKLQSIKEIFTINIEELRACNMKDPEAKILFSGCPQFG